MSPPPVPSSSTSPSYSPSEDVWMNEVGGTVVVPRPDSKKAQTVDISLEQHLSPSSVLGEMTEGLLYGDFKKEQTLASITGQLCGGLVPILGQLLDLRDTGAALDKIWRRQEGGFRDLALSLLGWVPGVGDVAKHTISTGLGPAGKIVAGTIALGESFRQRVGELFEQLTSRLSKDSLAAQKVAELPRSLQAILTRGDLSEEVQAQAQEALSSLALGVETGTVRLHDNAAQVFSLLERAARGSPAQATDAIHHLKHAAAIVQDAEKARGALQLTRLALEVGENTRISGLPPLGVEKLSPDVYFQTIEHLPDGEKIIAHHLHEVTSSVNSFANKMKNKQQPQKMAKWLHKAEGADIRHIRIVVADPSKNFSRAFDKETLGNILDAMKLKESERALPLFRFGNTPLSYNDLVILNDRVTTLVPQLMKDYRLIKPSDVYSQFFNSPEKTFSTLARYGVL